MNFKHIKSYRITIVDLFNQTINNEYRITILEKVIERMTKNNPNLLEQKDVEEIQEETLIELQKKYPAVGIKKETDMKDI